MTEKEAFDLEIKEIASHDNLTNISLGGKGGDNITNNPNYDLICRHISEGCRKRLEDPEERKKYAHFGKNNGMYGKHMTNYTKQKLLEINSKSYEERYGKEIADKKKNNYQ